MAAGLAGCTGSVDGLSGPHGSGPQGESTPGSVQLDEGASLPEGLTEHLTRAQYDRVATDLLGFPVTVGSTLPPDDVPGGFEVGQTISPALADAYFSAAETLAEQAVENMEAFLPCAVATNPPTDTCIHGFIATFGRRAFRRPLTEEEATTFRTLYDKGFMDYGAKEGIQLVVHGALASPYFLYRVEPVPEGFRTGEIVPVDDFVMASRLSFFLWNSMPDDALLDRAEAGNLHTADDLGEEIERMLADARSEEGFRNFYRQWLDSNRLASIEKDGETYPEYSPTLAKSLRDSLDQFVDQVVWREGGGVTELLTASFSFANGAVADLYGIESVEGNDQQRIEVDIDERLGLLSHPALLTVLAKQDGSDPIHRGKFVREEILCQKLQPPPDDVIAELPEPEPGLTTRERFAQHSSDPSCSGCHSLIDPLGFGFEHYDGVGKFRTMDGGESVDASGEVTSTDDANGEYTGVPELAMLLADSDQVQKCMARQIFRYASGRTELPGDSPSLNRVYEAASGSGWSIRDLLVFMVQTDAFQYLRIPEMEE
ncbi:MAG: DUF1592 domain-containing protein [Myxococcales bacterium]|nr:DUF1592 domain-containing protein [Myxococcales bacterium]